MSKFATPRLALFASAAALVLAACFDGADNQPVAPASNTDPGHQLGDFGVASAGLIQVCVDIQSPPGPYSVEFSTPGNVVMNDPEDLTTNYTRNDVLQPSPQTGINPGECRLLFTKNNGTWIDGFGWTQSFTTMTITNTRLSGGTFSFICFPGGGPSELCTSPGSTPIPGDLNDRRQGEGPTATSGANPDHGSTVTFLYTPPTPTECTLGYPDDSNLPRSGYAFNESEVLAAYAFKNDAQEVRAWYTDEHALLLGQRQIVLKIPPPTGTMTLDHTFDAMTGNPSSVIGTPFVRIGSNVFTGDGAASDDYGRPLFPAVYITDITSNPDSRSGDWQHGGTPYKPNKIFGTWKGSVATVDYTRMPYKTTYTTDRDPAKNHLELGPGADPVPAGVHNGGYSTEVVWSAASLGLNPTHNYRLQFMVHDGDQNKTGGDVGQACMNIGPNVADRLVVN